MNIESVPQINIRSVTEVAEVQVVADGVVTTSALGRPDYDREGMDDPGRIAYLQVFDENGNLKRDHVIRRDPGRIKTETK